MCWYSQFPDKKRSSLRGVLGRIVLYSPLKMLFRDLSSPDSILQKYKYPPVKQDEAVQMVLDQAESLCAEWA